MPSLWLDRGLTFQVDHHHLPFKLQAQRHHLKRRVCKLNTVATLNRQLLNRLLEQIYERYIVNRVLCFNRSNASISMRLVKPKDHAIAILRFLERGELQSAFS